MITTTWLTKPKIHSSRVLLYPTRWSNERWTPLVITTISMHFPGTLHWSRGFSPSQGTANDTYPFVCNIRWFHFEQFWFLSGQSESSPGSVNFTLIPKQLAAALELYDHIIVVICDERVHVAFTMSSLNVRLDELRNVLRLLANIEAIRPFDQTFGRRELSSKL